MSKIEHGTVRMLSDKGYGFIASEGTPDVFFHASTVVGGPDAFDQLTRGAKVAFVRTTDQQGRPNAATVRPL